MEIQPKRIVEEVFPLGVPSGAVAGVSGPQKPFVGLAVL
jgi:hypothetical protein